MTPTGPMMDINKATPATLAQALENGIEFYEKMRKERQLPHSPRLLICVLEVHVYDWLSQKFGVISTPDVRTVWERINGKTKDKRSKK